jgi:hypothetical protein
MADLVLGFRLDSCPRCDGKGGSDRRFLAYEINQTRHGGSGPGIGIIFCLVFF